MSRRRAQIKRQVEVDPVYGTRVITKFINSLMIAKTSFGTKIRISSPISRFNF